jgi:hypothetical protein
LKAGCAIQPLGRLILTADLKAQSRDAFTAANTLGKSNHTLAQLLAAKGFVQIQLVKQGKAAVKFQAETECKNKIARQRRAAKDEIDLAMLGRLKEPVDRAAGGSFVEAHVLLCVEFAHHLQQGGKFLVRQKLEEDIHKGNSTGVAIFTFAIPRWESWKRAKHAAIMAFPF